MERSLSIRIAEDLLEQIHTGKLKANDKLLSERELSHYYNASRNIIRESIKILVEKNLVVNIHGKGNYISKPTESTLVTTLEAAINYTDISISEVIDARELLEISVMEKFLFLITDPQILELEKIYNDMNTYKDDYIKFSECDTSFHLYLIGCSNNSLLKIFLSTLYNLSYKNIVTDSSDPDEIIRLSQIDHREIIDSIKEKNSEHLAATLQHHIAPLRGLYI